MPRIAVDEQVSVICVRAQWSQRAHIAGESSWHFVVPGADSDPQTTVWEAWNDRLLIPFCSARATSWLLERVLVEDTWTGVHAAQVHDLNHPPVPAGAGPGTPGQISPLISWRTGEIGRNSRGRTFMGPYTVSSVEDDNVVDPGLSAVYDFAEAMMRWFRPAIPGTTPLFVIWSQWEDLVRNYPGWYLPVVTYFFHERWATVRRRMQWDWRT